MGYWERVAGKEAKLGGRNGGLEDKELETFYKLDIDT